MSFAKVLGTARKPPRIVTLTPNDFADTYEYKPTADVAVGLRLLAERDIDDARRQAIRRIDVLHRDDGSPIDEEARDEAYNDALMCWAVAKATCNVNDVTKPYFDLAEDLVSIALTPEAIRGLWDELVFLQRGKASTRPPAADDEIADLARLLEAGAVSLLGAVQQAEIRKLLAYARDVLSAAAGANDG